MPPDVPNFTPSNYRILIVEDDETMQMLIKLILGRSGFEQFETAVEGTSGLEILEAGDFDLLLLDALGTEEGALIDLAVACARPLELFIGAAAIRGDQPERHRRCSRAILPSVASLCVLHELRRPRQMLLGQPFLPQIGSFDDV